MSASDKFNSLVSEIGEDEMKVLCKAFLTQLNQKPVNYQNLTADTSLDPMNCPLHSQLITGEIFYPNSDGEYPVYAPPCYGCSIGITHAIK